ncbi:MAG TPA: ATP-dependent DNA ligase [bacterium]|nr:ATP-dependent DNA ligase [bacterium]
MTSSAFSALAATLEDVLGISATLGKIERLAAYLATLDDGDLRRACPFVTGAVFPAGDPRRLQVGWALIADVLTELTGASEDELRRTYLVHGDLGDTASALVSRRPPAPSLFPRPLTLAAAAEAFAAIAAAQGPASRRIKHEALRALFRDAIPLEVKFLVKILTADLRVGLRGGLLLPAIARAFGRTPEAVRQAALLIADPGEVAVRARADTLGRVTLVPGSPFRFMLAGSIAAIDDAFVPGAPPLLVEDKYDGIRVQIHRTSERLVVYSRTLDDVTGAYPELHPALSALAATYLLDGEIVAWQRDRPLPFARLQRRLGRQSPGVLTQEIPVVLMAFDLLHLDGRDLLRDPLEGRREAMADLGWGGVVRMSRATLAFTPAEAEARFRQAREAGHEGIVLKRPDASYQPGRRGRWWLKWKPGLATLDVVVVAAEYGHGKRARVLSDYTFAVRAGDHLATIGKAYSGLTDAEIARLTQWFLAHTVKDLGRVRLVEPRIVLEVAFDKIMESARHTSGFALRFPRIVRVRDDKPPEEINTLDDVRDLHRRSGGGDAGRGSP